ncbi:chemotaxis protein CheW [Thauera terpenica]|nr:chemotaxis protein CheW [Thauera terpenica]
MQTSVMSRARRQQPPQQTLVAARQLISAGGADQYPGFVSGGRIYVYSIFSIHKIIEISRLTEAPMMPASVRSVIKPHTVAVPVIDLRPTLATVGLHAGGEMAASS